MLIIVIICCDIKYQKSTILLLAQDGCLVLKCCMASRMYIRQHTDPYAATIACILVKWLLYDALLLLLTSTM